ncbi:hypothetical protein NIE88_08740 [Sporolactobacillus shoreicorticis]|uniref:Prephenate dehydratase n=1 Tax=Sporolactobacillus shoreicorticis TaxID=1923877 RepID=A0ABW5S2H0_9BACL|nr:hypothetical protein [Sporolactobacillus shoreicorticis]MCO7125857.1 hypothetical protein [Sporolactobacillus shoreicorticis]
MIIHTLGPEATDSCRAAQHYERTQPGDIRIELHDCFENIIEHFNDYQGDCFLIPTAFKSCHTHLDWADIHYTHLDQLKLVTCFCYALDPLVLIRRLRLAANAAYTHPSTAALMKDYLHSIQDDAVIHYTDSKYLAYQNYRRVRARYVITNQKNVQLSDNEKIERTYTPDMVWCLYQILKKNR